MYNKKLKIWVSDCDTDELKLQCKNPDYANDEYTMFLKASEMLSKIKTEKNGEERNRRESTGEEAKQVKENDE